MDGVPQEDRIEDSSQPDSEGAFADVDQSDLTSSTEPLFSDDFTEDKRPPIAWRLQLLQDEVANLPPVLCRGTQGAVPLAPAPFVLLQACDNTQAGRASASGVVGATWKDSTWWTRSDALCSLRAFKTRPNCRIVSTSSRSCT